MMDRVTVYDSASFLDASQQSSFFSFVSIGFISIFLGFLSAGRNGFMFDTRTIRGVHRFSYGLTVLFFSIYSVTLSISQYLVNNDVKSCHQYFTLNNSSNSLYYYENCNSILYANNIIFLIILIIDPLYIYFFYNIVDYRSKLSFEDRFEIRLTQRKDNVIPSLVIIMIRFILIITKLILTILVMNIGAILLIFITLITITFSFYLNIRLLFLYNHWIFKYSKIGENVTTLNKPIMSKTQESDEEHILIRNGSSSEETVSDKDDVEIATKPKTLKNGQRPKANVRW